MTFRIIQESCQVAMPTLPSDSFDVIIADPPYGLSNGGRTCRSGRAVRVDKGAWDRGMGAEQGLEWHLAWMRECQRLLSPTGTIWVSGTHHAIGVLGYAMRVSGLHLLNVVTWQKPCPPPNLACRNLTHSTEFLLWARKTERSKHRFNYADCRKENHGKQMKDVWTIGAPRAEEKAFGHHPTQKPVALTDRIMLVSGRPGGAVLDPFAGSGTSGVSAIKHSCSFVGIEPDPHFWGVAMARLQAAEALRGDRLPGIG